METAFRQFMRAQADLTALIGSDPFRWYAMIFPQHAAYPAVRFRAESPPLDESYSQGGDYVLTVTRIDLEVWAITYEETLAIWRVISRAVRAFMRDKANTPQGTIGSIPVQYMVVS